MRPSVINSSPRMSPPPSPLPPKTRSPASVLADRRETSPVLTLLRFLVPLRWEDLELQRKESQWAVNTLADKGEEVL